MYVQNTYVCIYASRYKYYYYAYDIAICVHVHVYLGLHWNASKWTPLNSGQPLYNRRYSSPTLNYQYQYQY